MVQTNKKKQQNREERLKSLPQSERLLKTAMIKKKEGRVLDSSEKHAMKMASEHGEIVRLWEVLRSSDENPNENEEEATLSIAEKKSTAFQQKYPIVTKLMALIEPKFSTYVKTPSMSRVIQSMIKYGSSEHIERITKAVNTDFVSCATDAYGRFVVVALMRHANRETFRSLLAVLLPVISQLVSHKFGVQTIHSAYSSRWSSAADRDLMLLSVFKEKTFVMKKMSGYPVLEDMLRQNPSAQKRLLSSLFNLVEKLVSQKDAIGFPFVQRLAYVFLQCGTREEVSELCDSLRPYLVANAQSREGAPLASLTFSLTHPKKRREILREVKDSLGELCSDKYAAPFIARLFDLLYDHQLLSKYLTNDMAAHIGQVVNSDFGYRIFMHLLTPHESEKMKYVLPNWKEHNLYSIENSEWNHHTWLTADYEEEVVEICSKPAAGSHAQALRALIRPLLDLMKKDEKKEGKVNHHHVALIARQLLRIEEADQTYREALSLSSEDRELLGRMSPASGSKTGRQEEEQVDSPPRKRGKAERHSLNAAASQTKNGAALKKRKVKKAA